jgi:hypothetical protein
MTMTPTRTPSSPRERALALIGCPSREARSPPRLLVLAVAAFATLSCGMAAAAGATPAGDAQHRYQRERARCETLKPRDAVENCLSEASTAFAQSRPLVTDPDPGLYLRNALRRCAPLPDAERRDCEARTRGDGTTSGSAASGGILRELVTREPAASAPYAASEPAVLPR